MSRHDRRSAARRVGDITDLTRRLGDMDAIGVDVLEYLVAVVGAEQVMLGTDYPFAMGEHQPVKAISEVSGLTDAQKRSIMSDNAAAMVDL